MTKPADRPSVLVLGSLARNTLLVPSKDKPQEFLRLEEWVGAPLLREMICQSLPELSTALATPAARTRALHRQMRDIDKRVVPKRRPDATLVKHSAKVTTVFGQLPKTSDPKERQSVLRVRTQHRSLPDDPAQLARSLGRYMERAIKDQPDPDVLVLFDSDDVPRECMRSRLTKIKPASGRRVTVVGFARDIHGEALDWLGALTPKVTGGPARTVAIVRAEALRKAGHIIVESGPIERTVRDLIPCLRLKPLKAIAERASHLVILFEELGAVYVKLGATELGTIHLSSNSDSIALEHAQKFGRAPGRMAIALAAVVRQLCRIDDPKRFDDLSPAVRFSIAAFNRYFIEGYDRPNPLVTLKSALSCARRDELKSLLDGDKPNKTYLITSLRFPMTRVSLSNWSRLDDVAADDREGLLRKIVLRGPEAAFRRPFVESGGIWHPQALITCPYMQVGKLKTFDEEEIEGFSSLTKLFRKYLKTPGWNAPLSIAVFGPPGTGKSFAVRELMTSINPAAEKGLTFNLSQFRSLDSLNDAFHDVQHRVLSSEDVPLVFFDEFDATFEGELGWLKYFLAPMQDGVFRSKASDYRIGRAFFVFAGGTSETLKDFRERGKKRAARSSKLPDFISRLQGFLDIQSINRADARESTARLMQRRIKRALLLRSLLLTHATDIIETHDGEQVPRIAVDVIDAFLNAASYVHGLRSMESVVRMSKWIGGEFLPASLPAKALLEMHVTGFRLDGPGGQVTLVGRTK